MRSRYSTAQNPLISHLLQSKIQIPYLGFWGPKCICFLPPLWTHLLHFPLSITLLQPHWPPCISPENGRHRPATRPLNLFFPLCRKLFPEVASRLTSSLCSNATWSGHSLTPTWNGTIPPTLGTLYSPSPALLFFLSFITVWDIMYFFVCLLWLEFRLLGGRVTGDCQFSSL